MKNIGKALVILMLCMIAIPSQAKWTYEENISALGGYTVKNTKSGQRLNTKYKTKKQAKKAAKILNKSDKSVMADQDGQGDHREGGELPFGR